MTGGWVGWVNAASCFNNTKLYNLMIYNNEMITWRY